MLQTCHGFVTWFLQQFSQKIYLMQQVTTAHKNTRGLERLICKILNCDCIQSIPAFFLYFYTWIMSGRIVYTTKCWVQINKGKLICLETSLNDMVTVVGLVECGGCCSMVTANNRNRKCEVVSNCRATWLEDEAAEDLWPLLDKVSPAAVAIFAIANLSYSS